MKRHILIFGAVLLVSIAFQAWFLGLLPGGKKLGDPKLVTAYTEALGSGQSYLKIQPDPRVLAEKDPYSSPAAQYLVLDTSLFHGKYYLYFGIVPFALLLVPVYKLTGVILSPESAILIFCVWGYVAYGSLLLFAIRRWTQRTPALLSGAAFITIIVASGTWPLMARPAIYEIENAAAYAFLATAFLLLFIAEGSTSKRTRWHMLAAAAAALTMGCRPNYFPAVAVIAGYLIWRAWCTWSGNRGRVRHVSLALAPLLAVGLCLAWWNYHRFGDPVDFGLKHTVSQDPKLVRPLTRLANLPYGLHRYTVGRALLSRYFPFIQGPKDGPVQLAHGQERSNQVYGFLLLTPILLFGGLAFGAGIRKTVDSGTRFTVIFAAAFAANFLFLASVTQSCYRYPADFLGPLAALSGIGIMGITTLTRRVRWGLISLFSILLPWSCVALYSQTFATAQMTELYDEQRPADFARAARPLNHVEYLYERVTGDGPRGIILTVQLPSDKFGGVEPLFVDGVEGAQDFLYLVYSGPGSIRIGFESSGYGGTLSPYTKLDYAKPHTIAIFYGSFLPPDDHPLLRGLPAQNRALARRMITVLLDGRPVLDSWATFHLPRGSYQVGESSFDAAFGAHFTGKILGQELPNLTKADFECRFDRLRYGPLAIDITPVPLPPGVYDPVLCLGDSTNGAELLLESLGGNQFRLRWVDSRGQRTAGPRFELPTGGTMALTVTGPCLLPPVGSSTTLLDAKATGAGRSADRLTVESAGKLLLEAETGQVPFPPGAVSYGADTLSLVPSVMPVMSGRIASPRRLPW